MIAFVHIFVSCIVAFSLLDLVENDSNVTLHSFEPWTYRSWADVAIDSRDAWQRLSKGNCKRSSGSL